MYNMDIVHAHECLKFFTAMCFLHFTLLIEHYLQPCPSCFTSFPTNSKSKNSILGTNLDQMGNKASISIPSSIRPLFINLYEKLMTSQLYIPQKTTKSWELQELCWDLEKMLMNLQAQKETWLQHTREIPIFCIILNNDMLLLRTRAFSWLKSVSL